MVDRDAIRLSVVIPAHNAEQYLQQSLSSLFSGAELPWEVIVVDDGSTDGTSKTASTYPVRCESTGGRWGPAYARNLGARVATGDVLLFLDADVCVGSDTVARIRGRFVVDPTLDALIGSYDNSPRSPEFISQYRNLLHAYVHQTGSETASTFWSGCGAIRRPLFLEHSGFDIRAGRPAIEDIELGYRLVRACRKIVLDRDIKVTHLKSWTFFSLVKTDILDRGIPWTELILRERFMPNDLNLHLSQRVSVALVFILVALSCALAVSRGGYFLIPLFTIIFALLARWWIEFATPRMPREAAAMLIGAVVLVSGLAWWQGMFRIIPPLLLSPVLLLIKHCYAQRPDRRKLIRAGAAIWGCFTLGTAALYLPADRILFVCFALLGALGILNSQFYLFLAGSRGVPFMLASIPFHLLYHFYNGISFVIGTIRFSWSQMRGEVRGSVVVPTSNPEGSCSD